MIVRDGRRREVDHGPLSTTLSRLSGELPVALSPVTANMMAQRRHAARQRVRYERREACLTCGKGIAQPRVGRVRVFCGPYCRLVEYRARKRVAA